MNLKQYFTFFIITFLASCVPVGKQSELDIDNKQLVNSITSREHKWDFKRTSEYTLSDANKLKIQSGVYLVSLNPTNNSEATFNGTHDGTEFTGGSLTMIKRDHIGFRPDTLIPNKASNLVGHWPMDNNWQDRINSNNGTAVADATFTEESLVGYYAGDFDGTGDGVTVPHASELSLETLSISVKFKPTGNGKLKLKKRGLRHILTKQSRKTKRQLRKTGYVHEADTPRIKRALPYLAKA